MQIQLQDMLLLHCFFYEPIRRNAIKWSLRRTLVLFVQQAANSIVIELMASVI